MTPIRHPLRPLALLLVLLLSAPSLGLADDTPSEPGITFEDLMRFRSIEDPTISDDGAWVAWALVPDRGDGEGVVRSTAGDAEHRVERGKAPRISTDGAWAAFRVEPAFAEREAVEEEADDAEKPKPGLALVATADGETVERERVERFAFSDDGRWIAWLHHEELPEEPEEGEETEETETAGETEETPEEETAEPREGTKLVLRHLASGEETVLDEVADFAFSDDGALLAVATAVGAEEEAEDADAEDGETGDADAPQNALRIVDLSGDAPGEPVEITAAERGRFTHLAWSREGADLAFVAAVDDEESGEPGEGTLWIRTGDGETRTLGPADVEGLPEGWIVASKNELRWSHDGERLFFGTRPAPEDEDDAEEGSGEEAEEDTAEDEAPDPYDTEEILDDVRLDVWHGDDPLIQTNQKQEWEEEKDRVYAAVHHLVSGETVQLADEAMREIRHYGSSAAVLGLDDASYLKERTWIGWIADLYRVDLATGERTKIAEGLRDLDSPSLSPDGRWSVFFQHGHWHLHDAESGTARVLTRDLDVPFANEDHDYPAPAPSYGAAGWLADSSAVLIHDKWDLWSFPTGPETAAGEALRITGGTGRAEATELRVVDLRVEPPPGHPVFEPGERLLVRGYRDRTKNDAYFTLQMGTEVDQALEKVWEMPKHLRVLGRAEGAEKLLYTRESYEEFPDLRVADLELDGRTQISDANPELDELDFGTVELVEWRDADGEELQGVLIKPAGYEEGERVPVLVYFYRLMSQRLHRFKPLVVNHRPSFQVYASDGYAIFLPDIRFEVGRPGFSATKALLPGVQKLVELGVADPEAIGLHGHSWSGYQAAFVITQTDYFAATVAGAPVSNMTSAYAGIRWHSGLARLFQYEQSQSRIGASLVDAPHLYIENSPVFFADRVNTPLLIQFGDEDGAVPWTQGIELYLALRRHGKDVVMLQYRGEGHHLEHYPNKLDYSIKMKQFFDHHLRGAPAPEWWTEGVAYEGE